MALPLEGRGGSGLLTLRYGRPIDSPIRVEVLLSRQSAGFFEVQPGRFRSVELPVRLPEGPLRVDFWPENGGELGVAIDWFRIEGGGWRIPLAAYGPRLLVGGAFALLLLAGFALPAAGALAAALALLLGAWAALDPFACVHVLSRIAWPALLSTGLVVLLLRHRPGVRFLTLIFLAGYLAKGAALFHPSYFYNDVRNNRRFAMALARPGGLSPEQRKNAQAAIGVAYPRIVAGTKYVFPYSPVFYLPFTFVRQDHTAVDEALKHVALFCSAGEVALVFWISGLVFGAGAGVGAAFVGALLPVFVSRLLLALWSTLGGHFWDTLLLGAALLLAAQPDNRRRLAGFGATALLSLLTYVASLFTVTLFSGCLALLVGRLRTRVAAVWAAAVAATLTLLYADFVGQFATEILPALLRSKASLPGGDVPQGVAQALGRIPIFYGYGLPALAVAGFVVARRAAPDAARVLGAYALAFAGLVALRVLPGGLFKDMKEVEFVAPLVAILAGASLEELFRRGRSGRVAAVLIGLGLLAFAADRSVEFFTTWTALAPP
jgi:hypothetical protein